MSEVIINSQSKKMSEMQYATSLHDSDLMLLSRQNDQQKYGSGAITVGVVTAQLSAEFVKNLNLNTMTKHDTEEYAKVDHQHDYSNITVSNTNNNTSDKLATIVVQSDDNKNSINICYPDDAIVDDVYKPDVGEVMLLARTDYQQKDVNSKSFDGWVYCDGSSYLASDFPSASKVFSKDSSDNSRFVVPNFSNFLKVTGTRTYARNKVNAVVKQNGHTHNIQCAEFINASKKFTVNATIPVQCGGDADDGTYIHSGYKDDYQGRMKVDMQTFSSDAYSDATTTQSTSNNITETKPTRYKIPTLVYIGLKGE